jgi:predicted alpha/beta superfamily hydrolase
MTRLTRACARFAALMLCATVSYATQVMHEPLDAVLLRTHVAVLADVLDVRIGASDAPWRELVVEFRPLDTLFGARLPTRATQCSYREGVPHRRGDVQVSPLVTGSGIEFDVKGGDRLILLIGEADAELRACTVLRIESEAATDQISAHGERVRLVHDSFTMHSTVVEEMRRINVYLPPQYATDGDTRFPVLYMPDGGVAEDFPHIAETLDAGIRAGEIAPMLLVGIENTQRRRDMTPPTTVDSDRTIAPVVGGSAKFRAFISDELLPEIARRFRVNDERAIIGESLAGLFIVETLLVAPGLFDTAIALSPSLWWNDHALVRRAADVLEHRTQQRERLILAEANEADIVVHVAALANVLRDSAPPTLQWAHTPRPDLRHDTIYRALAPTLLRQHFPKHDDAGATQ